MPTTMRENNVISAHETAANKKIPEKSPRAKDDANSMANMMELRMRKNLR
jgi:hypothetical protein